MPGGLLADSGVAGRTSMSERAAAERAPVLAGWSRQPRRQPGDHQSSVPGDHDRGATQPGPEIAPGGGRSRAPPYDYLVSRRCDVIVEPGSSRPGFSGEPEPTQPGAAIAPQFRRSAVLPAREAHY